MIFLQNYQANPCHLCLSQEAKRLRTVMVSYVLLKAKMGMAAVKFPWGSRSIRATYDWK
jgi:hypothetical protein